METPLLGEACCNEQGVCHISQGAPFGDHVKMRCQCYSMQFLGCRCGACCILLSSSLRTCRCGVRMQKPVARVSTREESAVQVTHAQDGVPYRSALILLKERFFWICFGPARSGWVYPQGLLQGHTLRRCAIGILVQKHKMEGLPLVGVCPCWACRLQAFPCAACTRRLWSLHASAPWSILCGRLMLKPVIHVSNTYGLPLSSGTLPELELLLLR